VSKKKSAPSKAVILNEIFKGMYKILINSIRKTITSQYSFKILSGLIGLITKAQARKHSK
jgi:formate hydrogenlyase subunit 6/NADH:ubiquinone oxidoreductase subunit I